MRAFMQIPHKEFLLSFTVQGRVRDYTVAELLAFENALIYFNDLGALEIIRHQMVVAAAYPPPIEEQRDLEIEIHCRKETITIYINKVRYVSHDWFPPRKNNVGSIRNIFIREILPFSEDIS